MQKHCPLVTLHMTIVIFQSKFGVNLLNAGAARVKNFPYTNLDLTILLLSVLTNSMQSEMSVDMEGGIGVIQKFCSTEVDNGEIQNRLTKIHDLLNRYLNNV